MHMSVTAKVVLVTMSLLLFTASAAAISAGTPTGWVKLLLMLVYEKYRAVVDIESPEIVTLCGIRNGGRRYQRPAPKSTVLGAGETCAAAASARDIAAVQSTGSAVVRSLGFVRLMPPGSP